MHPDNYTGYIQNTIKGAERSSSATAYLAPRFLSRNNLHVLVGAQVSRVLQTGGGKVPAFRGVEFRTGSEGMSNHPPVLVY